MAPFLATLIITSAVSNTGGATAAGNSVITGSSESAVSVHIAAESDSTSSARVEITGNGASETYATSAAPGQALRLDIATSTFRGTRERPHTASSSAATAQGLTPAASLGSSSVLQASVRSEGSFAGLLGILKLLQSLLLTIENSLHAALRP